MVPTDSNWSRRDFLKAAGAAGVGSVMRPIESLAESSDEPLVMPTRTFGKTGVKVPILALGGSMDLQQLILRQAIKWGVTYPFLLPLQPWLRSLSHPLPLGRS